MAEKWIVPDANQQAQAGLAAADIVELVNRQIREGMDPRIVLAGIASATCDVLTSVFGPAVVAPWFESQAQMVRDLQRPS